MSSYTSFTDQRTIPPSQLQQLQQQQIHNNNNNTTTTTSTTSTTTTTTTSTTTSTTPTSLYYNNQQNYYLQGHDRELPPLSPSSSVSTSTPPTSPLLGQTAPAELLPLPSLLPNSSLLSNVLLKNIEMKNNSIVNHTKWSDEQLRELRVIYDRIAQRLIEDFEIEISRKEWKLYLDKKDVQLSTRPSSNITSSNCLARLNVQCPPIVGTAYTRDWQCRYQYDKFLDDYDLLYYYTCNDKTRAKKHNIPYSDYDVILLRMTTNKMIWVKSREATMIQVSGPHPTRPKTFITVGCTVDFSGTPPHPSYFKAGCSMLAWLYEPIGDGKTSHCTHVCNFDFARDTSSIAEIFVLPMFPKFPLLNAYFKLLFIRSKLKEIQSKSDSGKQGLSQLLSGSSSHHYSINRKKLAHQSKDAKKRVKITIDFTNPPNDWVTLILQRATNTNWKTLASNPNSKLYTVQYNFNHTLNDRKLIFIKTSLEYDCTIDKLSLLLIENYINWDKFVHTIRHADRGVIVSGGGGSMSKKLHYNVPSFELQCLRYFGYSDGKPFAIEERENGDICFYLIRKTVQGLSAIDIYFLVYKNNWLDKLEIYSNMSKEKQIGKTIKSFLGGSEKSKSKPPPPQLSPMATSPNLASSTSSVGSNSSQSQQPLLPPSSQHNDNGSSSGGSSGGNRQTKDFYYFSIVQMFETMIEGVYFQMSTEFLENLKVLTIDESLELAPLAELPTRFKRTNSASTIGHEDMNDVNMIGTPTTRKRTKETHETKQTDRSSSSFSSTYTTMTIDSRKASVCSIGGDISMINNNNNNSQPSFLDSHRPDSFLLPPFFPTNHYWKPTQENMGELFLRKPLDGFSLNNNNNINNNMIDELSNTAITNNNNNNNNTSTTTTTTSTTTTTTTSIDSEPYILMLPQELLHHIFSFLGDVVLCRLSRTCKYFKMVSESDSLWYPVFETMFESIPTAWKKKFLCKIRTEALWSLCTDTQPQNNGLNYYPNNKSALDRDPIPLSSVTICSYRIYPSLVTIYPKSRSDSISSCLLHHSKAYFATDQNNFIQANIYENIPDKMFKRLNFEKEINNIDNNSIDNGQDDIEMGDSTNNSLKLWLNERGILTSLCANRRLYKIDTNHSKPPLTSIDDLMEEDMEQQSSHNNSDFNNNSNTDHLQQPKYITLINPKIQYPAWDVVGCSNSKSGELVALHYNSCQDNNDDHDTVVDLFSCSDGKYLRSFDRGGEEIAAIDLNMSRLGVGGFSGPIDLYDINTASKVLTFLGHTDKITSLNVLDDEDIVVASSKDCTVKFYDERGGPYYVKRIVTTEPVRRVYTSTTRVLCATKSNLSYYDPRNLSKPIGQLWNPPKTNVF
ncbi:WD40 repeat-containing protein [Cavenderia fasciculata]|uniref:WD40 repeat-containing protein n=1 Tax=Cavenderia fasciculata TaxID=261658 RepID=F4Q6E1_CACFS|nr:WD40 repeat-containing protein [Cavenderia fasciculata]EGG16451.1 WD40 repeat-containing protein [Cavenderia fasciculata]|eukprot:XP_004354851.1 WD40 repeat-containing protein [Cavenderia fasciculata]